MTYAPNIIDLSRVPAPDAIAILSSETMIRAFLDRFKVQWDAARVKNPRLPVYDADPLELDPVVILAQAWSYFRLLDRQAVNDAVKAVFAPLAKGADLDNIAASVNIVRQVIQPATDTQPEILESDERLLYRYLLAFDAPSAGSKNRFILEAMQVWPLMGGCQINGYAVHGRRGDVDVVVMGPNGRDPTNDEIALVRNAVLAPDVRPEAVAVNVLRAKRIVYDASFVVSISDGPERELVRNEVKTRVRNAATARTAIGGQIPEGYLIGSTYGGNVLSARDRNPIHILPDLYSVPVLGSVTVLFEDEVTS